MMEWADRGFLFSGYGWKVKGSDTRVGPGPNYFSDSEDNVWLDAEGHLHLRITHVNNTWQCAEVIGEDSFGYGRYEFHLAPGTDDFSPTIVLGLFTWDNNPEENNREIDIELARWGEPASPNAQYVIQPSDPSKIQRFDFLTDKKNATHWFDWRADRIDFGSEKGDPKAVIEEVEVVQEWTYRGPGIPTPGEAQPRINLWLFRGLPPSEEQEVVITRFEVIP